MLKHELVMSPVYKKFAAWCKLVGSLHVLLSGLLRFMFSASVSTFSVVLYFKQSILFWTAISDYENFHAI